jgi:tRNA(adenine34) deaminase
MDFERLMHSALAIAAQSGQDVPVGALLVAADGQVVASAHNQKEAKSDATSHAEIEVIRLAGQLRGDWRLDDLTLVVTLEPCVMCAGAIVAARIPRVVFGAFDEKVGAAGSLYDLLRDSRLGKPTEVVAGILESECQAQLKDFFLGQRGLD